MKTLLTIKQQHKLLASYWEIKTLTHRWSARGAGSSRILNAKGSVIAKATGGGYDRYGTALGNAITTLFPTEVLKLAKRECKGKRRTYKTSTKFYGLQYNAVTGKAWLDGGTGHNCMELILNKIGFSLEYAGETDNTRNTGESFYLLTPITKHDRRFLK